MQGIGGKEGQLAAQESVRYILTGTGRCGTGYASVLLTKAGIKCGHEMYFHPFQTRTECLDEWSRSHNSDWRKSDSSWMAVADAHLTGATIIHIARNRADTIASINRIGVLTDAGPYRQRALELCPGLSGAADPVSFWVDWVYERMRGVPTWCVDTDPRSKLAEIMGLQPDRFDGLRVKEGYNSRRLEKKP